MLRPCPTSSPDSATAATGSATTPGLTPASSPSRRRTRRPSSTRSRGPTRCCGPSSGTTWCSCVPLTATGWRRCRRCGPPCPSCSRPGFDRRVLVVDHYPALTLALERKGEHAAFVDGRLVAVGEPDDSEAEVRPLGHAHHVRFQRPRLRLEP